MFAMAHRAMDEAGTQKRRYEEVEGDIEEEADALEGDEEVGGEEDDDGTEDEFNAGLEKELARLSEKEPQRKKCIWTRAATKQKEAYYDEKRQQFFATQPIGTKRRNRDADECVEEAPREVKRVVREAVTDDSDEMDCE